MDVFAGLHEVLRAQQLLTQAAVGQQGLSFAHLNNNNWSESNIKSRDKEKHAKQESRRRSRIRDKFMELKNISGCNKTDRCSILQVAIKELQTKQAKINSLEQQLFTLRSAIDAASHDSTLLAIAKAVNLSPETVATMPAVDVADGSSSSSSNSGDISVPGSDPGDKRKPSDEGGDIMAVTGEDGVQSASRPAKRLKAAGNDATDNNEEDEEDTENEDNEETIDEKEEGGNNADKDNND